MKAWFAVGQWFREERGNLDNTTARPDLYIGGVQWYSSFAWPLLWFQRQQGNYLSNSLNGFLPYKSLSSDSKVFIKEISRCKCNLQSVTEILLNGTFAAKLGTMEPFWLEISVLILITDSRYCGHFSTTLFWTKIGFGPGQSTPPCLKIVKFVLLDKKPNVFVRLEPIITELQLLPLQ